MGLAAEYVEKKPEMQMSQPMKMDDSKMMNMGK